MGIEASAFILFFTVLLTVGAVGLIHYPSV